MKKTVLILMFFTVFSKILGLGREMVLSYYYGASDVSDAYLISYTIPGTLFAVIAIGLSTSFIPSYSQISTDEIKKANSFTNSVINFITLISLLIIVLVLLFPKQIVGLFASGFDEETLRLTISFTQISVYGILFSGFTFILTSFLQVKSSFVIPALLGIPFNITLISSVIISYKYGETYLALGLLVAMAMQALFLIPFAYKNGYRYKPNIDVKDENFKKLLFISIPVIISVSINQLNVIVDRTLASQISLGAISALNYSNRLNFFVQGVFITSITMVIYPLISKKVAEKKIEEVKSLIVEAIKIISILVIPTTLGIMTFSRPIVDLVYGRGAFDSLAFDMTSQSLLFYSAGLFGIALRDILSNVFYSFQDTKTPMILAGLSMVLNIILNFLLSKYFGIGGLALATSISATLCSLLLLHFLHKKIGDINLVEIIPTFFKILVSSIVMVIISKIFYEFLLNYLNNSLSLIISIIFAVLIYVTALYLFKVPEVKKIAGNFLNKFEKTK